MEANISNLNEALDHPGIFNTHNSLGVGVTDCKMRLTIFEYIFYLLFLSESSILKESHFHPFQLDCCPSVMKTVSERVKAFQPAPTGHGSEPSALSHRNVQRLPGRQEESWEHIRYLSQSVPDATSCVLVLG